MTFLKLFQSTNKWKDKALARRQENRTISKRLKELIESRDYWKEKAELLHSELEDIKKNDF